MKKIAILILNYNTYEMTLSLLEHLNQILSDDVLRIVVDNASPNNSFAELSKRQAELNFILLVNKENGGYAKGNNVGLRYAKENGLKYVLLLNNDIIIESKNEIEKMVTLLESSQKIAIVSPILENINKTISYPPYPIKPSFYDLTLGYISYCRKRTKFNAGTNKRIYAPRGSCMLLRLDMIADAGYLDENTFLYYEEPIIAEKLLSKGLECWLCGEATVIHNHGSTISSTLSKKRTFNFLLDSYIYYLKEYRKWNKFKIILCVGAKKMGYYWR